MLEAVVLGTAQDGGLPHLGCACRHCRHARADPGFKRTASSLGLVIRDEVWLLDASPDVRHQVARLPFTLRVAGAIITHAHMGHLTGLLQFGKEGPHAPLRVYAPPRLAEFLKATPPYAHLFPPMTLNEWTPERPAEIPNGVVHAHPVTHRAEISETYAAMVHGPTRRLLYLSDTDGYDAHALAALDSLRPKDIALVDGTFWSQNELPGRDLTATPHPFVSEAIPLLQPHVDRGVRVLFTHMNHSNPIIDHSTREHQLVEDAGFEVAEEGMKFGL
jgi:pyrroloquinoline quinone biosynthesis protein B